MSDFLKKILEVKRSEVAAAKSGVSPELIRARAVKALPVRGFAQALRSSLAQSRPTVIAEIQKASPNRGLICPEFYPARIARDFREHGATCLSVITDTTFFQGSAETLKAARAASDLPVMRMDFIIDPYQVYAARAMGADAILLILQIIDDEQALELCSLAQTLGMDVLLEVHDEQEIARAGRLPSDLIVVNNRDLATFESDIARTLDLIGEVPADKLVITEGGITNVHEVNALKKAGVHVFLTGESFMREASPGKALGSLFFNPRLNAAV